MTGAWLVIVVDDARGRVLWLGEAAVLVARRYALRALTQTVAEALLGTVTRRPGEVAAVVSEAWTVAQCRDHAVNGNGRQWRGRVSFGES